MTQKPMKTMGFLAITVLLGAFAACTAPTLPAPTAVSPESAAISTSTPPPASSPTATVPPTASFTPAETSPKVVVNYSTDHKAGPVAILRYALTDPTGMDIYPLGEGSIALYAIYDTGSHFVKISSAKENRLTKQNWGNSDAGHLKVSKVETVNVRLNGLQLEDINGTVPISSPGTGHEPQVDLGNLAVMPDAAGVSLMAAPVTNRVVAQLNFPNKIIGLFSKLQTIEVNLYNPGDAKIPNVDLWLPLETIDEKVDSPDGATAGHRFWLRNVTFHNGDRQASVTADGLNLMFDTATTLTVVNDSIAQKLGLSSQQGLFNCFGGEKNGYFIDSIQMAGAEGLYQINNIAICWKQATVEVGDAMIGTNFFDQVQILVDGPGSRVGIIQVKP